MTNKNIKIRFNRRKLTNFDNFNHGTKAMFEEIEVSPYLDKRNLQIILYCVSNDT